MKLKSKRPAFQRCTLTYDAFKQ